MIKVLLVDDEMLAMEYLRDMIDWEKHGYCIVGNWIKSSRSLRLANRNIKYIENIL